LTNCQRPCSRIPFERKRAARLLGQALRCVRDCARVALSSEKPCQWGEGGGPGGTVSLSGEAVRLPGATPSPDQVTLRGGLSGVAFLAACSCPLPDCRHSPADRQPNQTRDGRLRLFRDRGRMGRGSTPACTQSSPSPPQQRSGGGVGSRHRRGWHGLGLRRGNGSISRAAPSPNQVILRGGLSGVGFGVAFSCLLSDSRLFYSRDGRLRLFCEFGRAENGDSHLAPLVAAAG